MTEIKITSQACVARQLIFQAIVLFPTWSQNRLFCRCLEFQDLDTCQRPQTRLPGSLKQRERLSAAIEEILRKWMQDTFRASRITTQRVFSLTEAGSAALKWIFALENQRQLCPQKDSDILWFSSFFYLRGESLIRISFAFNDCSLVGPVYRTREKACAYEEDSFVYSSWITVQLIIIKI